MWAPASAALVCSFVVAPTCPWGQHVCERLFYACCTEGVEGGWKGDRAYAYRLPKRCSNVVLLHGMNDCVMGFAVCMAADRSRIVGMHRFGGATHAAVLCDATCTNRTIACKPLAGTGLVSSICDDCEDGSTHLVVKLKSNAVSISQYTWL